MARKVTRYVRGYSLSVETMNELLFRPFGQEMGDEAFDRIQRQLRYYDYYAGKQHKHPLTGELVRAEDMPRPDGLDYDPTRYVTNYMKSFIQRKARWQMGGKHGVNVHPRQIDDRLETIAPDYEPSPAQEAENERAREFEDLLYTLWDENKMREQLIRAAKDRLIAGRVGAKILFNPNTGKLRWVFRPDSEIVPVFSDDDFEDLIACHFVTYEKAPNNEPDNMRIQTFYMENGICFVREAVYNQDRELVRTIQEPTNMEIDFIPVVLFPIAELSGQPVDNKEIDDMIQITDIINKMNEDAIDSLKFEMFPITAFINVPQGTSDNAEIAAGAMIEIAGSGIEGTSSPRIEKIESKFEWGDIFDEQYTRLKGALHELTNLPNIVPQELNFGGLNGEALHVLFHSIIQETEEHWLVWDTRLRELHEKSVRYLQARVDRPTFAYDRGIINRIGDNYDHEINFVLPIPDNRKELVDLLIAEVTSGFESTRGAIERLGVEDVDAKVQEIDAEAEKRRAAFDPYGGDDFGQGGGNNNSDPPDEQPSE